VAWNAISDTKSRYEGENRKGAKNVKINIDLIFAAAADHIAFIETVSTY